MNPIPNGLKTCELTSIREHYRIKLREFKKYWSLNAGR